MMLAGINNKKSQLFTSDVTGNYFAYYANAIGEGDDKVRTKLKEKYKEDLTIKKGIKLALDILKEIRGKGFEINKFEVAYIDNKEEKLKRLEGNEVREFVSK